MKKVETLLWGTRRKVAALVFVLAQAATATVVSFDLDPYLGAPSDVRVTVDDGTAGQIKVNVEVLPAPNIGDLRSLFFNLDGGLPAGITTGDFSGADITEVEFDTNNLGGSTFLPGHGLFDVGIEFGTPGIVPDDIQSTMFTIDTTGTSLSALDFLSFGARLNNVGKACGCRTAYSKLYSEDPRSEVVPEPGTYAMLGGGLVLLALVRRKRL